MFFHLMFEIVLENKCMISSELLAKMVIPQAPFVRKEVHFHSINDFLELHLPVRNVAGSIFIIVLLEAFSFIVILKKRGE